MNKLAAGIASLALVAGSAFVVTTGDASAAVDATSVASVGASSLAQVATGPTLWRDGYRYHGDDVDQWTTDPDAVPADPDGQDGDDNPANLVRIGARVTGQKEVTHQVESTTYLVFKWTRANEEPQSGPTSTAGDHDWRLHGTVDQLPDGATAGTILDDPDDQGYRDFVYYWKITSEDPVVETVTVYTWWVQVRDAWSEEDGGNGGSGNGGADAGTNGPAAPDAGSSSHGSGRKDSHHNTHDGHGTVTSKGSAGTTSSGSSDAGEAAVVPTVIDAGL